MMIEILPSEKAHKYLGRMLSLNPDERGAVEVRNRLRAAWAKFHQHRRWLLNRHVSLHLRLRLFATVVSPCALFAAMVLPLTKHDLEKFAVTQRKMLRNIVGWVRVPDEAWEDTMRRMKGRLERAMQIHYVKPWVEQLHLARWRFARHVSSNAKSIWPSLVNSWLPGHPRDDSLLRVPFRSQGRPRTRWDDSLSDFFRQRFHQHWLHMRNLSLVDLQNLEDEYLTHCSR